VELVTWNDWGEASYSRRFGSAYDTYFWTTTGPDAVARAFSEGEPLLHRLDKSGARRDRAGRALLLLSHAPEKRLRQTAKPRAKEPEPRASRGAANWADEVFVTLFLTAPAR
jgi:hypothetical protein